MAEVQDLRRRRDRREQPIGELVHRRRRHRERDLLQHDPVAARALLPGVEHAAVVLVGRDDLVAGLQVDSELRDLQRFAGVARDRELLGVAAERRRQAPPHRLDVRLEDLPHVVHGRLVREVEIALERLVHDARARAAAAVVQVDDGAIEREGLLDLAPVGLVCRKLRRLASAAEGSGGGQARMGLIREGRERGGSGATGRAQESASCDHARSCLLERIQYLAIWNR